MTKCIVGLSHSGRHTCQILSTSPNHIYLIDHIILLLLGGKWSGTEKGHKRNSMQFWGELGVYTGNDGVSKKHINGTILSSRWKVMVRVTTYGCMPSLKALTYMPCSRDFLRC